MREDAWRERAILLKRCRGLRVYGIIVLEQVTQREKDVGLD